MKKALRYCLLFAWTLFGVQASPGQGTPPSVAPVAPKTIKEMVKASKKYDGLFTIYQDTTDGSTTMLVKKDQIDKEYIYFSFTADGVIEAGHFRGAYLGSNVFTVKRYFNRVEFVTENTSFYFDKNNALKHASEANISNSVLSAQKIVATDSITGDVLIKSDDLFLTEVLQQVKPTPNPTARPGQFFSLGNLNKDKCKIVQVKDYPANTDVTVEYVYDNPLPVNGGGQEITDARYVSIRVQHSLIEVPQNDYKPRADDPRVGYFSEQVNDMTSASTTPYRDLIHRWNLKKKDPNAALSEPVEPIVWWIENTTPVELRETIKNAALTWNVAFEAAGFRNALQVKVQNDDADWDAGDIRYNVLRWTSSPQPPFGGYGPSFVNPRTGQILGADIMLEYIYVTNRIRQEKLFESAALPMAEQQDQLEKYPCSLGQYLHLSTMFGVEALSAMDASDVEKQELLKESIYYLVLHELGHTLGLNHNMKASQLYSPAEINNKDLTAKTGLTGSVMDYPAVNLAMDKKKQGQYFTMTPGPYDKWAIEYGYSPELADASAEKERLAKILARSTEPALFFGNDADDMRSPGKAIDPRVMINDMSNDAIGYSTDRIKLANSMFSKIKEKYSTPNQSYHELRNAFLVLTGEYANAATIVSRYIGGVYVDRGFAGQPGAGKPFTAVSQTDQKRAMNTLKTYVFGVDAFKAPGELYSYLQMQRRGFNFFSTTEDPKIHSRVLNIQRGILEHILHPLVLTRLNDSRMYGNQYLLSDFMDDLTKAVFADDLRGNVSTFRQNLQMEYVNRLIAMTTPEGKARYDYPSQSMAVYHLKSIERMLKGRSKANTETMAHTQNVLLAIQKAFEAK
ncbi:MAG: zinc-dependent metalloprotease [Bacteroidota bacterium]